MPGVHFPVRQTVQRFIILVLAAVLFLVCWVLLVPAPAKSRYILPPPPTQPESVTPKAPVAEAALFEERWVSRGATKQVHSASIVAQKGALVAVWYGGTREGASDTKLFLSRLVDGRWSLPQRVMDRHQAAAQLNRPIRKLGNPVIHRWQDDALGIFFVSVSLGGWATSSINYMESRDQGASWSHARRLVTSPFLNISTLVRASPLPLQDGSVQLPVYHEMAGKFAEALRISRQIDVLGKARISSGVKAIQPAIAPLSEREAVALLRYYFGQPADRVLQTRTDDGGATWTRPLALDLPNPGSSVALLRLHEGMLIAVLNDLEEHRYQLSLAVATTRDTAWRVVRSIEHEDAGPDSQAFEFSYPSLLQDDNGIIHLVYTWNQTRIKHVLFNRAWICAAASAGKIC